MTGRKKSQRAITHGEAAVWKFREDVAKQIESYPTYYSPETMLEINCLLDRFHSLMTRPSLIIIKKEEEHHA